MRSSPGPASARGTGQARCRSPRGREPPPTGRWHAARPSADRRPRRRRCRTISGRTASPRGSVRRKAGSIVAAGGRAPSGRRRSRRRSPRPRPRRRTEQPFDRRPADRASAGPRRHGRRGRREPGSTSDGTKASSDRVAARRWGIASVATVTRTSGRTRGRARRTSSRAAPAATPRTSPRARKVNSAAVTLSASVGCDPFGSTSAPGQRSCERNERQIPPRSSDASERASGRPRDLLQGPRPGW